MSDTDFITVTPRLEIFAVLEVAGPDAARFLQGQCTAQLAHADDRFAPLAVFCTPKGRVIANVRLLQAAHECYWLIMHPSLIDTLSEQLRRYMVFYKAKLNVRDDIQLQGLHAPTAAAGATFPVTLTPSALAGGRCQNDQGYLITLEGERCWLWLGKEAYPYSQAATPLTPGAWQRLQIDAGIAWLQHSQSDQWLPQMLNWEALAGISFKKGCYTGQEVVARAHFRGQVKRRLTHLAIDALEPPCVGDNVVDTVSAREVGTVLSVAPGSTAGWEMLAVVAIKESPVPLSIGGQLTDVIPLPYPIERVDPEQRHAALHQQ